jgi:hypothetical protein
MPRRHKLVQRRRQHPLLIHVPRSKCLGHAPKESAFGSKLNRSTITETGS